ncbi:hypothetical protein N7486_000468 [Penicillium sp. IBT 16267x]|nr:hypothetical protein N7486_000468 [Penicillium sp. IBT 16267x]
MSSDGGRSKEAHWYIKKNDIWMYSGPPEDDHGQYGKLTPRAPFFIEDVDFPDLQSDFVIRYSPLSTCSISMALCVPGRIFVKKLKAAALFMHGALE